MQAFHNTPTLGYIAWQDVHIQYKGTTYSIPNGNTNKRFVIWKYADPDCFYGSDVFPTLGPEDLLVFLNKNGTYAIVPKTQIVDGSLIVSDSIMTDAIAANAITTAKIAAGAITADLIAANAIGAGAIAAGAVTADKIAAGEIATTHLAALAVTADKIAANSISADKIAANAVGAEKIAAGAISADKLAAGAVTAEKIAAGAISTDKLSIGLADTIEATPRTIAPDTETYFPFDGGLASTRGAQPTFTRASTATNPETGAIVATDEPRFVEGRFGKAVLVEEGTTNYVPAALRSAEWRTQLYNWNTYGRFAVTAGDKIAISLDTRAVAGYSYGGRCLIVHLRDAQDQAIDGTTRQYNINTSSERQTFLYDVTHAGDVFFYVVSNGSGYVFEYRCLQMESKPYATSFVDGTRAGETLLIPTDALDPQEGTWEQWMLVTPDTKTTGMGYNREVFSVRRPANTIGMELRHETSSANWRLVAYDGSVYSLCDVPNSLTPDGWHHWAITWTLSELKIFLDGALQHTISNPHLPEAFAATAQIGYRLNTRHCGLRLHRRALTDEEIVAHAQAAAAPYDPRSLVGAIDADVRTVTALGNQITMDSTGLKMKNVDSPIVMMHLDANRLGFWDNHGEPSIGIGDVADMATALGSDMQYGLLLAQGEIRATEAVIRKSLAQGLVGQKHIEEGSVTLKKLSDLLSVTIPDRFMLVKQTSIGPAEESLTNPGFETGSRSGWTGTGTVQGTGARTGTYCVKNPNLYQECATWPGQTWQGYAYWYSDYSRTAIVELIFLDSTGAVLDTVTTSDTKIFSSWTKLTVTGTAPEGAVKVRFSVRYTGTADIWVDDCSCIGSLVHADGTVVLDHTIPGDEVVEQIWITASGGGAKSVLVNGDVRATSILVTTGIKMDVRADEGDLQVQVVVKGYVTGGAYKLHQNQRLPLRSAEPNYAVTITEASAGGGVCDTACQKACQSSCLAGCQDACEANCQTVCQQECMYSCQQTCQDACQDSCESTCEQTSQGGGCWVAGTPVTIYSPESETATEIPVEQLEPGMQMPYYNPATDTLAITECLSNLRSYTHTIYVAEVEGGWTLEMTGEQPMDVLRPHLVTGQTMWHRVQARYLRAGDKLIRPFDKALHEVLSVREESRARTWVWNPKTTAGAYIAHGFADAISKT